MKKIINEKIAHHAFLSAAIIVLFSICITFYSCNKSKNESQSAKIQVDYELVTKTFKKDINIDKRAPKWLKNLWTGIKVGCADIGGFVAGFTAGYTIGKNIDPNPNPNATNETGVGIGITAGTAAGILASDKQAGSIINSGPKYNPNWISQNFSNNLNPYDFVGKFHYDMLNDANNDNNVNYTAGQYDPGKFFNYIIGATLSTGISTPLYTAHVPFSLTTQVLQGHNINENFDTPDFFGVVNAAYDENILSENGKNILLMYFDALLNVEVNQLNAFTNYSIAMENMANADPGLLQKEKILILSTLATSRYGINYWSFASN